MEYLMCEYCKNKNTCNPNIIHYKQETEDLGVTYVADVWKCTNYNPSIKPIDRAKLRTLYRNNYNLETTVQRLLREEI